MKSYAVITGASSGIGREFAKRLAKKGYSLILTARRKDRLQKLARQLHTECEIITADLSRQEDRERVYNAVKDKKIEIFINNAGLGDCGPFIEGSLPKEQQMMQVNIQAVHYFTKKMLQQMQKSDSGFILNVASSAGLIPAGPYMSVYYASKAYVASLTRAAAAELKECGSNVYVGCLCPGPVDTEFNQNANVRFALKGISAGRCAGYALAQMEKRRTVIIPTLRMKLAVTCGRFLPSALYIQLVSMQQKKKIYKS